MTIESTLSEFLGAWSNLNVDHIMDFFADDAVFHNVPLEPAIEKHEIRSTIDRLLGGLLKGVTRIKMEVLRTVSSGGLFSTSGSIRLR